MGGFHEQLVDYHEDLLSEIFVLIRLAKHSPILRDTNPISNVILVMQSPLTQVVPVLQLMHYMFIFLHDRERRVRVNAIMWAVIVSGQEIGQNVHVPKAGHVHHVALYDFPHRPVEMFYCAFTSCSVEKW